MSEKQQKPETCIMFIILLTIICLLYINDRHTSQRSIATWSRCNETFDYYFITNLLL